MNYLFEKEYLTPPDNKAKRVSAAVAALRGFLRARNTMIFTMSIIARTALIFSLRKLQNFNNAFLFW